MFYKINYNEPHCIFYHCKIYSPLILNKIYIKISKIITSRKLKLKYKLSNRFFFSEDWNFCRYETTTRFAHSLERMQLARGRTCDRTLVKWADLLVTINQRARIRVTYGRYTMYSTIWFNCVQNNVEYGGHG